MKAAFEDLYQRMHGMPLREMDRIVDAVCTLCREHEKAGFAEGVKVGIVDIILSAFLNQKKK